MHPVVVTVFGIQIFAYGFMVALSFLAGLWVCARRAVRYGSTPDAIYDSAVPVLAAGLVGAKLTYFVTNGAGPVMSLGDLVGLVRGGFVFYGGVLGGAAAAIWWLKHNHWPVLAYGDVCAPGLAIALAVGRLGCFLNGCCYGRPAAWGMVFPSLGDSLPRIPTQLFEAAGAVAIGVGLHFVPPPPTNRRGRILGLFLIAYAFLRFGMEALRDDPRGAFVSGLSPSQWLSVVGLAIGIWLVARRAQPAGVPTS
ncbi:MAG: prolipoprotein diacylglyceryl transferase [Candidatus Coatesbacteria bacterium]